MNREQKMALTMVITTLSAFLLSCIAVAILYFKVGMPRALLGFLLMCLCGLAGFSPLVFKKDKGKVILDERDRLIKERAGLGGFTAAYLFVGMACMIPFFVLGPVRAISVTWLPNIFIGAGISHAFVYSVVILEQYGWREKGEKS
ncbi:MAG: hypothetical protein ACYSRR_04730 [Planctomycetota bacterium]|jgi:hypothetical protein